MTKKPQPYLKKKKKPETCSGALTHQRVGSDQKEGILQDGHAHTQKPSPAAAKGDKMQDKSVPELYS